MNKKLFNSWEHVRGSFWFAPSLMVLGAAVLALGLLTLDARLGSQIQSLPLVYTGGTQATRGLLSTIASSSITVAGTTFSITIAVLTLASSNYGPRLLRSFMHDTGNQVVLGTFVATFIYCLIVLRSVSDVEDRRFVPHVATTGAILLAFFNIAVLIYFIHHMTTSIQVSTIVHHVGVDLHAAIERIFPARLGHDQRNRDLRPPSLDLPFNFERDARPIPADASGYVQTIDTDRLLELTTQHDVVVRVIHRPGQFAIRGNPLVYAAPRQRVSDALCNAINDLFAFGKQRTLTQDVEFGMLQLVEVAVRALSPSLNDPYTAVNCLDQLSVALCTLADRDFPSPHRYDQQQHLRVIAEPVTFEHLIDVAFDQIRMNGKQFVMVLNKLLLVIAAVAQRVREEPILSHLRQHAALVERASRAGISDDHDQRKVSHQFQQTMHAITEREQALLALS